GDLAAVGAPGVAADGGRRREGKPATHLAAGQLDLPLRHARVAGLPTREEQESARERDHVALRVAPAAGLPVQRAGIALLGTLHLAVAAGFDLTARAAAVTRDGVAVVTLLACIQIAVPAGGGGRGTGRQGGVELLAGGGRPRPADRGQHGRVAIHDGVGGRWRRQQVSGNRGLAARPDQVPEI